MPLVPCTPFHTAEAALLVFGYIKGRFTGAPPIRSAIQTALIGGLAAAVAFGLAKAIS
jgi:vacuolar iron transporter family protein